MANTTIYPYGTNGQLPSSIGVINDLTTGGADKALSAEMGKLIGGREANDRARIDAIVSILKNAVFKDDESSAFAELDSLASAVDSISLNQSTIISDNGAQGATYQLTATTSPAGGTVSWSSSDASVASVDNTGLVEIVGNGTCTITATSGGKTATCSVTVSGITTLPAGFKKNKAWTDASDATGTWGYGNIYNDSLTDVEGYCVTPIYTLMSGQSSPYYSKYGVKAKSGCINNDDSSPKLCNVVYSLNSDDIYGRQTIDSDPQYKTSSANAIRRISFTFKISELANCYVYDFVAGEYLFAGSNIDTSVAPSADNNIDNNLINS